MASTPADLPLLRVMRARRRGRRFGLVLWVMAVWLGLIVFAALTVQWLGLQDPNAVDVNNINGAASAAHPLGTDYLGRDVLSRTVWSVRPSVGIGIAGGMVAAFAGAALAVVAGFMRGWVEELIVLWTNVMLAFPALVLILALVTFIG